MSVIMEIVEPFLAKVDAAVGPEHGAILYGSVARGEYVAGLSDINLLLVLEQLDSATLLKLEPAFAAWVGHQLPPPLLMTMAEWRRASDVFPIEITDMKAAYRVLRGRDIVAEQEVRRSDLRRALEREFRGKLNRLRQAFVPSERDPESLGAIARQSIGGVATLYRSLLVLEGKPAPADLARVLVQAADVIGFDGNLLADIAAHRGDSRWTIRREGFDGYLRAVELTVGYVDELKLGDQE
jgi:predicted nucleotidyltransferase